MEERTRDIDVGGRWWRFSDYQIIDVAVPDDIGFFPTVESYRYIRPSPGARLEEYQISVRDELYVDASCGNQESISYQTLLDLDLEDDSAITDWCGRYGLLGILLERAIYIEQSIRWEKPFAPRVGVLDFLAPVQVHDVRTNLGWERIGAPTEEMEWQVGQQQIEGRLVIPAEGVARLTPKAIVKRRLFSPQYEQMELGEAVGSYFPDIPVEERNTWRYPQPCSVEFWEQYSESLGSLRGVVNQLSSMLDWLGEVGPINNLPDLTREQLFRGQSWLHSLLTASPTLGIDLDGSLVPGWNFHSLLGAIAFRIWQDLTGGKSIRHCERTVCGKLFLSENPRRLYCSSRCRQAEEKARQRTRKRINP